MGSLPLLLLTSCVLLGSEHRAIALTETDQSESELSLGLKHIKDTTFSIVLLNQSNQELRVGSIQSALGTDQFLFKICTSDGLLLARRKARTFTKETLRPVVIPSGSYVEFTLDFADGSWDLVKLKQDSPAAIRAIYISDPPNASVRDRDNVETNTWRSVQAIYEPDACHLRDARSERNVYDKRIEGLWVAVRKPER